MPGRRRLLAAVAEQRPARLLVDALTDVQQHIVPSERLSDYLTALVTLLRAEEVTSLFAAELDTLVGPELRMPVPTVSAVLDNTILLRRFELGSQLHRLVSVIKVRQSAADPVLREFDITESGHHHWRAVLAGLRAADGIGNAGRSGAESAS